MLYPIIPAPSSGCNHKSSDNKTKPRKTLEKNQIDTHPIAAFMKKEDVSNDDPRQDLSTTCSPRTNDARCLKTGQAIAQASPNTAGKRDDARDKASRTETKIQDSRDPPKDLHEYLSTNCKIGGGTPSPKTRTGQFVIASMRVGKSVWNSFFKAGSALFRPPTIQPATELNTPAASKAATFLL